MIYEKIDGWFNYELFYNEMLDRFDNATFVEIGVWKGASIAFLAERIKDLKKNIKLYAIDGFDGYGEDSYFSDPDCKNNRLYETYLNNIKPLKKYITTIVGYSHDVYDQFSDESIDFLFLDGDHRYDGVMNDLILWYPKVKRGGVIGGHDYGQTHGECRVKDAVDDYFYDTPVTVYDKSYALWYYNK